MTNKANNEIRKPFCLAIRIEASPQGRRRQDKMATTHIYSGALRISKTVPNSTTVYNLSSHLPDWLKAQGFSRRKIRSLMACLPQVKMAISLNSQ